jgi:hypothetical protein
MKQYARTLVAIAFLFGLAGAVKAEAETADIVTVPFEFVVGAKVLPAGTYTVRSLSDDRSGTLMISSRDQGTSMFVLPFVADSVVTDKAELSFNKVGDRYFLSSIQTEATVYRIHVLDSSVNETLAKANGGVPAPGSRGGR